MLEKVKLALRITTDAFNEELSDLIESAEADMDLIGIAGAETDPLIRRAVITYCRMNFGEPDDYDKLKEFYDEQKAQMQISSQYKMTEVIPDGEVANHETGFCDLSNR